MPRKKPNAQLTNQSLARPGDSELMKAILESGGPQKSREEFLAELDQSVERMRLRAQRTWDGLNEAERAILRRRGFGRP